MGWNAPLNRRVREAKSMENYHTDWVLPNICSSDEKGDGESSCVG